jgi:hypothetical protein
VAVVGTKNIIAFGISYGLNPMVSKYSYPVAMGILTAVAGGIFLLGVPVYFFNPAVSLRFKSLNCSTSNADLVVSLVAPLHATT